MKKLNIYICFGILFITGAIIATYRNGGDSDVTVFLIGVEIISALLLIMFYYKTRETALLRESQIDKPTGLFAKSAVKNKISQILSKKKNTNYALMVIDIDDFKNVNDSFGHERGDEVIVQTAEMLISAFDGATIGRVGGDEFVVFFEYKNADEPLKKAEKFEKLLSDYSDNSKDKVQISASIGIASYPQDGEDYKTLFEDADKKLYQVKKAGKNGYIM